MDTMWQHVAKLVKPQGALMGDNGLRNIVSIAATKRQADKIVMFGRWNGRKSIETVASALKITGMKMVDEM